MDWQLVLDLGLVLNYMTKYVTKSDMSNNRAVHQLVKSVYRDTVTRQGRSTATFLRRSMGKLLGERIMSKQEKCHLMLGIPIVHSTHEMINVNLKNDKRRLVAEDENPDSSSNDDNANSTDPQVLMTLIDAYAVRNDFTKWKSEEDFQMEEDNLEDMSLLDFCRNFKVGQKGQLRNKICTNSKNIVVNFYPTPSRTTEHTEYCKNMLMRFKPWEGEVEDAWNHKEEDADIRGLWTTFLKSFGDSPPNFLQNAIAVHEKNHEREEASQRLEFDTESFHSLDSQDDNGDDLVAANTHVPLAQDDDDDIDMGVEWDKDHDWTTPNVDFELQNADVYKQHLTSIQDDAVSHERNAERYSRLNAKQKLAHDMILTACRNKEQGIVSSTDGGDGIG